MIQFSEAIKLKEGVLLNLPYHQRRVDATTSHFYSSKIDLSLLHQLITPQLSTGLYKCRVVYANSIVSVEFIPYNFRVVKSFKIVEDSQIEYSYKYADRSRINKLLAQSGCDEIIISKGGVITDASSSNLVFESEEGLFTPKKTLLCGTKRQFLLDSGIIREREIRVEEIYHYHSFYLINAMIDLEDGVKIEIS